MAKDTASLQPNATGSTERAVTQSDTANIANAVTVAVLAALSAAIADILADDIASAVQSAVADCIARRGS